MQLRPTSVPYRISSLDSLRGVAILLVMVSHFLPAALPLSGWTYEICGLGRAGVMLFFLLSGYLIIRNLERQPVSVFLSRRLFKILPSYWVNVAVLLLAGLWLGGPWSHPWFSFLAGALMVSDVLGTEAISGVYWTLLIEMKFYLFVSVHYALFRGRGEPLILAGLVGLNAAVFLLRGHGSQFLTCFPLFYVGAAIHRAEAAGWRADAVRRTVATVALLAPALALFADMYPLWSALYLVAGSGLFVAVLRTGLSNAGLDLLGRTSYSNYLYHSQIGACVLATLGPTASLSGGIALILLAFAIATATAKLLYHLVEEPMVRFGRRHEAVWCAGINRIAATGLFRRIAPVQETPP